MRILLASALLGAAALVVGCGEPERAAPPASATVAGRPASEFHLAHDLFLAADDPETVPAADARFLEDDDEVLGLLVGGSARAYPVPMIAYHHVVNDVVGGVPVAVTY